MSDADALVARLADAERRLIDHAGAPVPAGQTDPDPGGDERWDAGQVWAHIAEFPGYWLAEAERVINERANAPVPFGRTKTDEARIDAIERDRHEDPATLLARVRSSLRTVGKTVQSFDSSAWGAIGVHPTLGEMSVQRILERFVVEHLEEHADQLDGLRGEAT